MKAYEGDLVLAMSTLGLLLEMDLKNAEEFGYMQEAEGEWEEEIEYLREDLGQLKGDWRKVVKRLEGELGRAEKEVRGGREKEKVRKGRWCEVRAAREGLLGVMGRELERVERMAGRESMRTRSEGSGDELAVGGGWIERDREEEKKRKELRREWEKLNEKIRKEDKREEDRERRSSWRGSWRFGG